MENDWGIWLEAAARANGCNRIFADYLYTDHEYFQFVKDLSYDERTLIRISGHFETETDSSGIKQIIDSMEKIK